MASYKILLTKKYTVEWLLILVLLFALFVTALYAFSKKSETMLIAIDQNGTRVVTEQDDPIYKAEVINFIRTFVSLSYNWDQETFAENAAKYSELMSLDLWNQKKSEILRMADDLKKEPMQASTIITRIAKDKTKDGTDVYKVYANQTVSRRARTATLKYLFSIQVARTPKRTKENAYGYEITSVEESKVMDE